MPRPLEAAPPGHVSILSKNPETLDGLQSYLGNAGISAQCTSAVQGFESVAPAGATVAVIFPDDFAESDVLSLLRQLRRARPQLLALLVTREPQRFRAAVEPDGRSLAPLVLPKPCFGWDILDAIRSHTRATPI